MFKMEITSLPILIIAIISILTIFMLIRHGRSFNNLPPGPSPLPFLGNFFLLRKHSSSFSSLIHTLHAHYGPIFTLHFGSRPVIFIAAHTIAHQALNHNGAAFAGRPPASTTTKILYSNQITIFNAFHGPNWNLLRRNLVSEILHPSRLKLHSDTHRWSLHLLVSRLKSHSQGGATAVRLVDHFWPTMMELSVFMCFGLKIEEDRIKALADLLHRVLKAVIMETLRRHPPGHLALPHTVTEEVVLDGRFVVPEKTTVHLAVAEMARNEEVWEEAMEFRPERFLRNEEEEAEGREEIWRGREEIKLMPYGGGRRMCPGAGISMLHLQYFVGNLVWVFKWDEEGEVDLEEKLEVSIVMKTPLQARISARKRL